MTDSDDQDPSAASEGTPHSCDLDGDPVSTSRTNRAAQGISIPHGRGGNAAASRRLADRRIERSCSFERGDLLVLDANVPGADPGAYVFVSRLGDHVFLYALTEDATGALVAIRERVHMVPAIALPRFQALGSRLIPLGSQPRA